MAKRPDDPITPTLLISGVFFDLYSRYRALLAMLERHGLVPLETFETDVEAWRQSHAEQIREEWYRVYARVLASLPDPRQPE